MASVTSCLHIPILDFIGIMPLFTRDIVSCRAKPVDSHLYNDPVMLVCSHVFCRACCLHLAQTSDIRSRTCSTMHFSESEAGFFLSCGQSNARHVSDKWPSMMPISSSTISSHTEPWRRWSIDTDERKGRSVVAMPVIGSL